MRNNLLNAVVFVGTLVLFSGCETGEGLESYEHVYASEVVSFVPGEGAGFGQDDLPFVVLGEPAGSALTGSLDVLSLGVGGEIILGFGDCMIVDGAGPDFIVHENAFWVGGDSDYIWMELGEVSVSMDGENWYVFPCDPVSSEEEVPEGCAGQTPTFEHDAAAMTLLQPGLTGGDAYDLAELGLDQVRYVRIRDRSTNGAGPAAGFDLDSVAVIHGEMQPE